jgi:hypothetical protein
MTDVSAKVKTLRPGDLIVLPSGAARSIVTVRSYDDGTMVVVYSKGGASSARFGDERVSSAPVLASLARMLPDDRVRCRRAAT